MSDFNTLMLTGPHKFKRYGNIPANYFLHIWGMRKSRIGIDAEMKEFLSDNIDLIRQRGSNLLSPIDNQGFKCSKVTYATKSIAQAHLDWIRSVNKEGKIPIRSYECEFCNGWHLTSTLIEEFKNK